MILLIIGKKEFYSKRWEEICKGFCKIDINDRFIIYDKGKFSFLERDGKLVFFKGNIYGVSYNVLEKIYKSYKYNLIFEREFNGEWSSIILDIQRNFLVISTDHLSFNKIYFYNNNNFIISDNPYFFVKLFRKSLLSRRINKTFIKNYLVINKFSYDCPTIINGIKSVPPYSRIEIDLLKNDFIVKEYLKINNPGMGEFDSNKLQYYISYFKGLLEDSILIRMEKVSDKYSCETSGGIDSTAILCFLAKLMEKRKINKRLIMYSVANSVEDRYLKILKKYLLSNFKSNFDIKIIKPTKINFEKFREYQLRCNYLLHSFNILSAIMLIERYEREGITNVFDGDGNDELICGYDYKHIPLYLIDLFKEKGIYEFRNSFKYYKSLIEKNIPGINKEIDLLKRIYKMRYDHLDWKTKEFCRFEVNYSFLGSRDLFEQILEDYSQISFTSKTYNPDIIYSKPFLDRRIVEFFLNLPHIYKIYEGKTKFLLREAVKDIVPQDIVRRRKFGGLVDKRMIFDFLYRNKREIMDTLKENLFYLDDLLKVQKILDNFEYNLVYFPISICKFLSLSLWLNLLFSNDLDVDRLIDNKVNI